MQIATANTDSTDTQENVAIANLRHGDIAQFYRKRLTRIIHQAGHVLSH
jgi:hypothetical protein